MRRSIGDSAGMRAGDCLPLALALAARGDLALAFSLYRRTLRLAPEHPTAHYLLGLALMRVGAEEEAWAEWRAAPHGPGSD